MPGILTHLSTALVGGLLFGLLFKNYRYGLAFACGHIIPDFIDFGVLSFFVGEFDYYKIMQHPWFAPLSLIGHNFFNWMILALFVIAALLLLYSFKKVTKERVIFIAILIAIFLFGVGVHVILDALIIETSYLI